MTTKIPRDCKSARTKSAFSTKLGQFELKLDALSADIRNNVEDYESILASLKQNHLPGRRRVLVCEALKNTDPHAKDSRATSANRATVQIPATVDEELKPDSCVASAKEMRLTQKLDAPQANKLHQQDPRNNPKNSDSDHELSTSVVGSNSKRGKIRSDILLQEDKVRSILITMKERINGRNIKSPIVMQLKDSSSVSEN